MRPSHDPTDGCGCLADGEMRMPRRDFLAAGAIALPALTSPIAWGQPRRRQPARDYIIEASWALVQRGDEQVLVPDASVHVRGAYIVEVRQGRIPGATRRIAAAGQLLLPGFISGHTHAAAGTPTRGLIEGGRSYQRPLELVEALSDDDLDALTAHNIAELLRSGCTTHLEMSLSLRQAQSYVRVARRWHVRGYPGAMVPGVPRLFPIWRRRDDQVLRDSVPGTMEEIAAALAWARTINGAEDGLIRAMMTPHATDTHTPETMRALLAASRELGHGLHIHLAQGEGEAQAVQRLWGASPVTWMETLGAFQQPVFGAHMSAATAPDWAVMKRHGAVYSHCPSGGGAGTSGGSQPYPEALTAGVRTNIGIDTHSNDYVENLKQAVTCGRARARLLNRLTNAGLTLPTIHDAVRGATLTPAQALGRADLGRIQVGARADLTSIDVSSLLVGSGAPGPEPLNNLLYASGLNVRHVFTDGYAQVLDGALVVDDAATVVQRGARVVQGIWEQLRRES